MTLSPERPDAGFQRTLRNALHTELSLRMRHGLLHDLKGPGQIVLSALHMLQKNAATADAATLQKYCDWIRDAVKDMAARAETILPPKPAGADAPAGTCDLAEITEDVAHQLRDDSALQGVEFRIEAASGLPAVAGPAGELRMALQALLFGMLDRIARNETAYLRLVAANGSVEWSVSVLAGDRPDDSAFDIDHEVQPPASGIGWHVARSIVRDRGGDVTVENGPEDGWQLRARLPGV